MELLKGFKSSPSPENTRAIPGAVFHFLAMGNETNGKSVSDENHSSARC